MSIPCYIHGQAYARPRLRLLFTGPPKDLGYFCGGFIRVILGFYQDNGKEIGSYYLGFRVQGVLEFRTVHLISG